MTTTTLKSLILLFAFSILFSVFSCGKDDESTEPFVSPGDPKGHSYLALGDSYTIGQGVSQLESWPYQLSDSLLEYALSIDTLTVIAQTGWTTANLLDNIESQQPQKHDLVSLLIGVNDQFQSRPFEDFQTGFDELLQIAIDRASGKSNVMVISIPDYGVTPFGSSNSATIAMELDEYNAYMEGECNALDIPFINITTISRELEDDEQALASDNLHPSGYQYSKWVEIILPVALDLLED